MGKSNSAIVVAIVLIIIGGVFGFRGLKEKALVDEGFEDYNELSYLDVKDGMLVEGDLYYCYGTFAEEYETNYGIRFSKDSEALYYIIEAGNEEEFENLEYRYVGLKCSESWFDKMDDLTDATDAYMADTTGEVEPPEPVRIQAKVVDMTDDERLYFKEAFVESGISQDELDYYVHPVILQPYNPDAYKANLYVGVGGIAIGVIVLIIALVVNAKKKKAEDVYY